MSNSSLVNIVNSIEELEKDYEMAKGFWDSLGFSLYIAVKSNGSIGFSTKHWEHSIYIETEKCTPYKLWEIIGKVANSISRTLVRDNRGSYVYIPNLNETQTEDIFEKIVAELQLENIVYDEQLKLEWAWDVTDAVLFRSNTE